jgi:hypothetical protein
VDRSQLQEGSSFVMIINLGALDLKGNDASTGGFLIYLVHLEDLTQKGIFYRFE